MARKLSAEEIDTGENLTLPSVCRGARCSFKKDWIGDRRREPFCPSGHQMIRHSGNPMASNIFRNRVLYCRKATKYAEYPNRQGQYDFADFPASGNPHIFILRPVQSEDVETSPYNPRY